MLAFKKTMFGPASPLKEKMRGKKVRPNIL
jgi:hypothetical protein